MEKFQRIGALVLCVFMWQVSARVQTGRPGRMHNVNGADDSVSKAANVRSSPADNQRQNDRKNPQCQALAEHFTEKGLGSPNMVPSIKIHDAEMDICYRGSWHPHHKTCCNRQMEKQFHSAAVTNFMSSVQTTSSFLLTLLEQNSKHYQDMFVKMIQAAQNSTESLFDEVYKIPVRQRHGPINNLFMDLQAFVRLEDVVIRDSMDHFFDEIFPLVFQHIISDLGDVRLSDDYKLCLAQLREELPHPPFGDPAKDLSHSISKSLTTAKFFLRALHLLQDTLNTTAHSHPEHQCSKVVTRMAYCALCNGELETLPCRGYCLNVMRGCLASVSDLDKPWDSLVDQLIALTTNMRGIYNIETVMSRVHHRVSEAIMHSMEVGPKIYPKILAKCGKPEEEISDKGSSSNKKKINRERRSKNKQPDSSSLKTFWDEHDPELHSKIENFMRSLKASQGFYSSLPDAVCTRPEFSAGASAQCWNGEAVGCYNKTVVKNLLPDQKHDNPEMKVPETTPSNLQQLRSAILNLTEELSQRAMREMEVQSDSYYPETYRSRTRSKGRKHDHHYNYHYGSGDGYPSDDEEYSPYDDDWSGSGSGYESDDEGGSHHHYRTGDKNKPMSPSDNSEFEFENRGDDKSPYITPDNKEQKMDDGLGRATQNLALHSVALPFLVTILILLLRING